MSSETPTSLYELSKVAQARHTALLDRLDDMRDRMKEIEGKFDSLRDEVHKASGRLDSAERERTSVVPPAVSGAAGGGVIMGLIEIIQRLIH